MIIQRQKEFAAQDYAGVSTPFGVKLLNFKRRLNYIHNKNARSRHQRQLNKNLEKVGIIGVKTQAFDENNNPLTYSTGKPIMVTKHMLDKDKNVIKDSRTAAVVKENMIGRYNEKNGRSRGRAFFKKVTTKDNPTATYLQLTGQQQPGAQPGEQPKKGIGVVGKVAIGAGLAAAAYGGYRYWKAKKQQEAEEEEELQRQAQQQQLMQQQKQIPQQKPQQVVINKV